MVLEATMIIIDNSEYMRNGDYPPTRFKAQIDAVNVIFGTKTNANPENTVGLMSMAGKTPQVLATPTTDIGKILSGLHSTQISASADFQTGIQVAQLALKHRQNKNQRQRIIVFVGSPLVDAPTPTDERSLIKLAKKLKKNSVAVDVVSFGEEDENEPLLRSFVDNVQSGENSHLLSVPAGPHLLSEIIASSSILRGEDAGSGGFGASEGGGGGGGGSAFEFGVDPSLDPELAMALRMSMEEERARLASQVQSSAQPAAEGAASSTLPPVAEERGQESSGAATAAAPNIMDEDDEDEQLARALLLSQAEAGASSGGDEDVDMDEGDDADEEAAIARAIEMSMKKDEEANKDKSKNP